MSDEELNNDIFDGYGIKVTLKADFNKVRESLTRMGIANHKTKVITQTCHIFHKRGQYAIMHFLEMFLFDGKQANFTEADEARRNKIIKMLEEWGYIELEDQFTDDDPIESTPSFSVISRKACEEEKWTKVVKYTLGGKKKSNV